MLTEGTHVIVTVGDKKYDATLSRVVVIPSPAPAEEPQYPRVYRSQSGNCRVYHKPHGLSVAFDTVGHLVCDSPIWSEDDAAKYGTLLTGPEAAEYVAAAREGRDAVWPPKDADPWPHWWYSNDKTVLVRLDSPESGEWYDVQNRRWYEETDTEEWHARCGCYTRIPAPEAAALLAKWEGERKSEGEKRTEKWFTKEETERRVGEIVASVKPADPRRRVKHTWTGKCGSIITIHGGIAFVDWDGEDASSMFLGLLVDEDAKPPVPEVSPPALPGAEEVASKVVQEVSAAMTDRNSLLTHTIREAIAKAIEEDRQRGRRGE